MKLAGCTALITGASAGIGWEFARQLASRARALVLVARRTERLEELRAELISRNTALEVHLFPLDLSKHKSVSALCDWLNEKGTVPDFLINNAGLGDHGTFATSDFARVNDMLQVNVVSLTLLTRKLLPPMVAARRGAILNVSSCASFLPLPGMAVYAAGKAYVTSFSEALRTELRDSGITVSALCPGPVETEFNDLARRPGADTKRGPKFTYVDVADCVRVGLHAIEHNRPVVVPGAAMKFAMLLTRLAPMPLLRIASRFAR
jgi:short-subunit dehydrogenase